MTSLLRRPHLRGLAHLVVAALGAAGLTLGVVACSSPSDTGAVCSAGLESCGGVCTNTASDAANCGACGKACGAGEVCSKGACALSCGGGTSQCGSSCVDENVDPANCGSCNHPCAAGSVCSQGACALVCLGGTTKCGAACVDTNVDPANCGKCGNPCGAGEVCSQGTCGSACGGGTTQCGSTCVDTNNDPANCGGCNHPCGVGQACNQGICEFVCSAGGTWPEYACDGVDENCNGVIDDGCPTGIAANNTKPVGTSPLLGNPTGGTAFGPDICPKGDVAVGIYGDHGGNIDRFGMECAPISVVENNKVKPYTYVVRTGAVIRLPIHGTNNTTPYEVRCPADRVLTRISGYFNAVTINPVPEGVHQLSVYCSPAAVTGHPSQFSLVFGPPALVNTVTSTYPLTVATPFTFSCSNASGYVGAVAGRAGAWVDALQFSCYDGAVTLKQ